MILGDVKQLAFLVAPAWLCYGAIAHYRFQQDDTGSRVKQIHRLI